jgi:hypothetical protein
MTVMLPAGGTSPTEILRRTPGSAGRERKYEAVVALFSANLNRLPGEEVVIGYRYP